MQWECNPVMLHQIAASIRPIATETPLRNILNDDFPKDSSDLPIGGGWGYTKKDAIKFLKLSSGNKYNFVSLEYHIIQKIIYEELIIFRHEDDRFSEIRFDKKGQHLSEDQGFKYDVIKIDISCWHDVHWNQLKAELGQNNFDKSPGFDQLDHDRRRSESQIKYDREFWFDVTDVFGS